MTYFYGHLFAADPEIRAMFPAAMSAQRQSLHRALRRIAAGPDTAGAGAADPGLTEYLAALGRAHRKFGVRKEHYDAFRAALEATFRRYPPDAPGWSPAAWAAAFDKAAEVMIGAAADDAARAPAWWTAEVIESELPTPHVTVLTLRPDQPLRYLPGQHIAVQTPHWPRVWRCYSIANAPREDGILTLHVRAIPGGLVSTALLHAAPGDTIVLGPAEGAMTADLDSGRDVLCLAGGTGLAPLKAIAEAIGQAGGGGRQREITLYFGARTAADLYDLPSLRAMEAGYPALRVLTATSQERAPQTVHAAIPDLAAKAPWEGRDVYISGPDAMIVTTAAMLGDLGVPAERLHYDLPA